MKPIEMPPQSVPLFSGEQRNRGELCPSKKNHGGVVSATQPHHCRRAMDAGGGQPPPLLQPAQSSSSSAGSEPHVPSRGEKPPLRISSRSQRWRSVNKREGSLSASANSSDWRGASRAKRSLRTPPWGELAIVYSLKGSAKLCKRERVVMGSSKDAL